MIDCSKTETYLKEKLRMCKSYQKYEDCEKCGFGKVSLDCDSFALENPYDAIEIVQKWSDEHPPKTFLDDVLEKFPKAKRETIITDLCPKTLGYEKGFRCDGTEDCEKCWNRPYLEEAQK